MYLIQLASGAISAGSPLALQSAPVIATNENVAVNTSNNGLIISSPGYYNVRLQAVFDASATTVGAQLYANGNAVVPAAVTVTTVIGDLAEVVIEYPVKVISAPSAQQALVQFFATVDADGATGYIEVEKIA